MTVHFGVMIQMCKCQKIYTVSLSKNTQTNIPRVVVPSFTKLVTLALASGAQLFETLSHILKDH